MKRLFLILLAWPSAAEAACQTYTVTQMCPVGGSVTTTVCTDQNGACTSAAYSVGNMVFPCGAGCDCNAAAQSASDYCAGSGGTTSSSGGTTSSSGSTTSDQPCGGTCATTCCHNHCLGAGEVCCGSGICQDGDQCCNGTCYPGGDTCCSGWSCPNGAACTPDGCCPDGLKSYDANLGYCCGITDEYNTSTICECATQCTAIQGCCPGNTVCCARGWCASSTSACPFCGGATPTYCDDGSCAPSGAVCCGGGLYCPNGLSCADSGGGVITCGGKTGGGTRASKTSPPTNSSGAVRAVQSPVTPTHTGTAPTVPTVSSTGASGGTHNANPFGCGCRVSGRADTTPWAMFAVLAIALGLRRRFH